MDVTAAVVAIEECFVIEAAFMFLLFFVLTMSLSLVFFFYSSLVEKKKNEQTRELFLMYQIDEVFLSMQAIACHVLMG